VEAGGVLTPSEWAALSSAAGQAPAVAWSLTVAHALSNADDDRAALAGFDRLKRDHPFHPGVRLGRARALAGLERYAEAEGELREALRLNPGDPEALKSLALMALRKGEPARARALVADARRADPLDAEARLIEEELSAADLPPAPRGAAALLAAVRPVLRPPNFSATAPQAVTAPGPAGLALFFVVDDPNLLRYVSTSMVTALGLSTAELERAAWAALERHPTAPRPVEVEVERGFGAWALAEGDGYDAARLLCRAQQALLTSVVGPGPYAVDLGHREYCLLGPVEALAAMALSPAPDGIHGRFVLQPTGALEAAP